LIKCTEKTTSQLAKEKAESDSFTQVLSFVSFYLQKSFYIFVCLQERPTIYVDSIFDIMQSNRLFFIQNIFF